MSVIHDALKKAMAEPKSTATRSRVTMNYSHISKGLRSKKTVRLSRVISVVTILVVFGVSGAWLYLRTGKTQETNPRESLKTVIPKVTEKRMDTPAANDPIAEGMQLYQTGQYLESIRVLEKNLTNQPGNANVYNTLGLSYMKSGNLDKARNAFLEAIRLENENPDAYFNLAVLCESDSKITDAIHYYTLFLTTAHDNKSDVAIKVNERIQTLLKVQS